MDDNLITQLPTRWDPHHEPLWAREQEQEQDDAEISASKLSPPSAFARSP